MFGFIGDFLGIKFQIQDEIIKYSIYLPGLRGKSGPCEVHQRKHRNGFLGVVTFLLEYVPDKLVVHCSGFLLTNLIMKCIIYIFIYSTQIFSFELPFNSQNFGMLNSRAKVTIGTM